VSNHIHLLRLDCRGPACAPDINDTDNTDPDISWVTCPACIDAHERWQQFNTDTVETPNGTHVEGTVSWTWVDWNLAQTRVMKLSNARTPDRVDAAQLQPLYDQHGRAVWRDDDGDTWVNLGTETEPIWKPTTIIAPKAYTPEDS
jgi:hypothetical protein